MMENVKINLIRMIKMIYTSYFGRLKQLPEDIIPISICGKAPEWYTGLEYKTLAPKYKFFMEYKQNHDINQYTKCYYDEVLYYLNPYKVLLDLTRLSKGKDVCLICYEKPENFCHRHLVAKWLNKNDIPCEEYKFLLI